MEAAPKKSLDLRKSSNFELVAEGPSTSRVSPLSYYPSSRESSPFLDSINSELVFSSNDGIYDGNYEPPLNNESDSGSDQQSHHNKDLAQDLPSTNNVNVSSSQTKQKKWATAVRKERSTLLNTGKSYVNVTGKFIEARKLKPLKECRKKCSVQLSEEVRRQIFQDYWQLGSHDKRANYVANSVSNIEKKVTRPRKPESTKKRELTYEYFFHLHGKKISVCKSCFCTTIDEKETFIRNSLKKKNQNASGIIPGDGRGKTASVNKKSVEEIDEVLRHIHSFPAYESQYSCRRNNKKYLPSHLNLSKMYSLYKQNCPKPVSRRIYRREFHKLNLEFKKPSVD